MSRRQFWHRLSENTCLQMLPVGFPGLEALTSLKSLSIVIGSRNHVELDRRDSYRWTETWQTCLSNRLLVTLSTLQGLESLELVDVFSDLDIDRQALPFRFPQSGKSSEVSCHFMELLHLANWRSMVQKKLLYLTCTMFDTCIMFHKSICLTHSRTCWQTALETTRLISDCKGMLNVSTSELRSRVSIKIVSALLLFTMHCILPWAQGFNKVAAITRTFVIQHSCSNLVQCAGPHCRQYSI